MIKRNKLFSMLAVFSIAEITLGYVMFCLKGEIISRLFGSESGISGLLICFGCVFLLYTFAAVSFPNIQRFGVQGLFSKRWKESSPLPDLQRESSESAELFFIGISEQLPKLDRLQMERFCILITGSLIYSIYFYRVIRDGFYLALCFVPFFAVFSTLGTRVYATKLAHRMTLFEEDKINLLKWLKKLFFSYKELKTNWQMESNPLAGKQWYEGKGEELSEKWHKYNKSLLTRDIISRFFIEVPYLVCICAIFIACAKQQLPIASAVVWLGLVEYLMRANRGIRKYFDLRVEQDALSPLTEKNIFGWRIKRDKQNTSHSGNKDGDAHPSIFSLLDGTLVEISTSPGFYRIPGGNGAGKSTLLDTISGLNADYHSWDSERIACFQSALQGNIRFLARNPTIFSEFTTLEEQICGPYNDKVKTCKKSLENLLRTLLPKRLSEQWLLEFHSLKDALEKRKGFQLSSGEKILLSWFRCAFMWYSGEVKALVVDECEAFLDLKRRALLRETIQYLSEKIAIYEVSHIAKSGESEKFERTIQTLKTSVHILAYDEDNNEGLALPLSVTAFRKSGCSEKNVVGYGNIARSLCKEFSNTLSILEKTTHLNFKEYRFILECESPNADVEETGSARLAIAAALVSLYQEMLGETLAKNIAATGYIGEDGHIEKVRAIHKKLQAAKKSLNFPYLLTPYNVKKVQELFHILSPEV